MSAKNLATAMKENGAFIHKTDDTIFLWVNRRWIVIGETITGYHELAVVTTDHEGNEYIRRNCLGADLGDGWAISPGEVPWLTDHYPTTLLAVQKGTTVESALLGALQRAVDSLDNDDYSWVGEAEAAIEWGKELGIKGN